MDTDDKLEGKGDGLEPVKMLADEERENLSVIYPSRDELTEHEAYLNLLGSNARKVWEEGL